MLIDILSKTTPLLKLLYNNNLLTNTKAMSTIYTIHNIIQINTEYHMTNTNYQNTTDY